MHHMELLSCILLAINYFFRWRDCCAFNFKMCRWSSYWLNNLWLILLSKRLTRFDNEASLLEKPDHLLHLETLHGCISKLGLGDFWNLEDVFSQFLHLFLLDHEILPIQHLNLGLVFTLFEVSKKFSNFSIYVFSLLFDLSLLLRD